MTLEVEYTDKAVVIKFDRPEKYNAMSLEMSRRLGEALDEAQATSLPLVLRSKAPGMFVSGNDLNELAARGTAEALARPNQQLFQRVEDYPWPTIAAVAGPALGGGCELALACDFRVTTASATWGLPEVRLGVIPAAGGVWRLPRLIGWSAATDLIMTGRRINGTTAYEIGLAQRLTSDDQLDEGVDGLLGELARTSLEAVRLAKEAMRIPSDHRRIVDAAMQALCYASVDTKTRLTEFLNRSARAD